MQRAEPPSILQLGPELVDPTPKTQLGEAEAGGRDVDVLKEPESDLIKQQNPATTKQLQGIETQRKILPAETNLQPFHNAEDYETISRYHLSRNSLDQRNSLQLALEPCSS